MLPFKACLAGERIVRHHVLSFLPDTESLLPQGSTSSSIPGPGNAQSSTLLLFLMSYPSGLQMPSSEDIEPFFLVCTPGFLVLAMHMSLVLFSVASTEPNS